MKKLLLVSTAIVGVALLSSPASAAVKLDLGGYFSGYGVFADNNEVAGAGNSLHSFEFRRNTEIHVGGETVLDNGLTVGFHSELGLGDNTDFGGSTNVVADEAYAYASGGWGRFNLGSEDGAAYLLQVGAPSADSNIDGMRVYIQALNPQDNAFGNGVINGEFGLANTGTGALDYDQVSDPTGVHSTERLTYLTPKFNGFQGGVSYAPTVGQQNQANGVFGMSTDQNNGQYDNVWDASARWDGEFQGFGISLGGGYSDSSLQNHNTGLAAAGTTVVSDGLRQWNLGANIAFQGFSLGGSYLRGDSEVLKGFDPAGAPVLRDVSLSTQQDTWVGGLGWDNGPYHLGASYLHTNVTRDGVGVAADAGELSKFDATADRYTIGGGYTFGPGMTFRGAVAWGQFDNGTHALNNNGLEEHVGAPATNNDFTQVSVGTDIQF